MPAGSVGTQFGEGEAVEVGKHRAVVAASSVVDPTVDSQQKVVDVDDLAIRKLHLLRLVDDRPAVGVG